MKFLIFFIFLFFLNSLCAVFAYSMTNQPSIELITNGENGNNAFEEALPQVVTPAVQIKMNNYYQKLWKGLKTQSPVLFLIVSTGLSWYTTYLIIESHLTYANHCGELDDSYSHYCSQVVEPYTYLALSASLTSSVFNTLLLVKHSLPLLLTKKPEIFQPDQNLSFQKMEGYAVILVSTVSLISASIYGGAQVPRYFEPPPGSSSLEEDLLNDAKTNGLVVVAISGMRSVITLGIQIIKRWAAGCKS